MTEKKTTKKSPAKKTTTKAAATKSAKAPAAKSAKKAAKAATAAKKSPAKTAKKAVAAQKATKATASKSTATTGSKGAAAKKKAAPAATKKASKSSARKATAKNNVAQSKTTSASSNEKRVIPPEFGYLHDKKWLASQRETLVRERASYTTSADRLAAEAAALMADRDPGDVQFDEESGEGDTIAVERDRDLALSAAARQSVSDIDAALERLDSGTYGMCVAGDDIIPQERLEAIPEASVCVKHKTLMF